MLAAIMMLGASFAAPTSANSSNPLANAEKGQLQCYRPNVQKKTCQSIASYERTGPGTYDNKAVIPVSNEATLETHTPVVLKGDAVCGSIRLEDLASATLRVGDRVVDHETAKPILERIAQGITPLVNQEICTQYEPTGADFTARISIESVRRPDQDQPVKWIGRSDGYKVAP